MAGHRPRRPELKFERARIDRARSNLFAASRPAGRWNAFLIPADCGGCYSIEENAISSVRGQLFAYERKIHSALPCYSRPRTTSDTRRCCWKSANWREVCLIYGTHVLRAYIRESRDRRVYLGTSTRLNDFFRREIQVEKSEYKFPWSI